MILTALTGGVEVVQPPPTHGKGSDTSAEAVPVPASTAPRERSEEDEEEGHQGQLYGTLDVRYSPSEGSGLWHSPTWGTTRNGVPATGVGLRGCSRPLFSRRLRVSTVSVNEAVPVPTGVTLSRTSGLGVGPGREAREETKDRRLVGRKEEKVYES